METIIHHHAFAVQLLTQVLLLLTALCFTLLQLEQIQSRLLDVGSAVATPIDSSSESKLKRVQFDSQATSHLEVGSCQVALL